MNSGEQWTMGSESVGGARRRFRRHKEKIQSSDGSDSLPVRGMYRAIDALTRITAHVDIRANEDLLRTVGNTLTDEQSERLRLGVPAFKIGNEAFDEVKFDGKTWMYSLGQKDIGDTTPNEMYRATLTEHGVDWERMIVGVDDGFVSFEPDLDDIKSLRLLAQDAAKTALNS